MRIHRFFVDSAGIVGSGGQAGTAGQTGQKLATGQKIKIADEKLAHQWRHVLRFQVGQEVVLFDGSGSEFRAIIETFGNAAGVSPNSMPEVGIISSRRPDSAANSAPRPLFLFLSLAKRDSFEWTLEKATELGVAGFQPLISERSEKKKLNLERSRDIVKEASEQSGRVFLPEIFEPKKFSEILVGESSAGSPSFAGESIALDPRGNHFEIDQYKKSGERPNPERLNIFVGPEGGWSEREIELFHQNKIPVFSLGKQILRAETAAVAVAALLLIG